jgi:hypothetical protein
MPEGESGSPGSSESIIACKTNGFGRPFVA